MLEDKVMLNIFKVADLKNCYFDGVSEMGAEGDTVRLCLDDEGCVVMSIAGTPAYLLFTSLEWSEIVAFIREIQIEEGWMSDATTNS